MINVLISDSTNVFPLSPSRKALRDAVAPKAIAITHGVADAYFGKMKKVVVAAATAGRESLSLERLASGFASGMRERVYAVVEEAMIEIENTYAARLPKVILETTVAAGKVAARSANKARHAAKKAKPVGISFTEKNARAVEYAKEHSAKLIVDINKETRSAIREIVVKAFEEGLAPRQSARLIRPLIGLNTRDANAVANLAEAITQNPGGVVWAGSRRIVVPEGGASDDFLDSKVEDYADTLLDGRAEMIARTETIAASTEGQRELWLDAVDAGLLIGDELRVWITTPDDRLCPICEAMDGELAGLEEPFDVEGDAVMSPPAHPQCRCAIGISNERSGEASSRDAAGALGIPFKGGTPEYHKAYNKLKAEKKKQAKKEQKLGIPATPSATPAVTSPSHSTTPSPVPSGHPSAVPPPKVDQLPAAPGNHRLSYPETHAILAYQGSSSSLNSGLRSGNISSYWAGQATLMDAAFEKTDPLPGDLTVHRGIPKAVRDQLVAAGAGGVFEDKGFISTSKNTSAASGFGYRVDIVVPKGFKAIDMNKTLGHKSRHPGEHEVLLPRGTKFRIVHIAPFHGPSQMSSGAPIPYIDVKVEVIHGHS